MKKRGVILFTVALVMIGAVAVGIFAVRRFEENLRQLANVEIPDADLSKASDGEYTGSYTVFPVSAEVKVTIRDQAIQEIILLKHGNGQGQAAEVIPRRVTEAQSLRVDAVSGSTYSSQVILLAIADALRRAGADVP